MSAPKSCPHYRRLLLAERVEQADHIANQMKLRVALHIVRAVGSAVAALVGGDGMEASLRERRELVPPGVPASREPVQ